MLDMIDKMIENTPVYCLCMFHFFRASVKIYRRQVYLRSIDNPRALFVCMFLQHHETNAAQILLI